ncbi:N-acylneuraminate-9-phosphatase [Teleopsis dalmanni]|uniref:N-acylneuraminate-9-phosphatase n=1 Tax=Teleopsis dalmanni TaxID=139649 RepID=UPI0018CEE22A|nr:N-acylneuraminate-9-phosphatase [Teleopsis dalmanni]
MAEGTTGAIRKKEISSPCVPTTVADNIKKNITSLFFDLDNTLTQTRAGDLKACRKLIEVLENQFSFTKEESTVATQSFLKAFRRCPDNSQTSLDSWRTYLWRAALPERYKNLAEHIYPKWLQLRYRYLALSPEYIQMLKRFREAGFLLALITNGPSNAQWEKIKKLNVSQYFDCVLVSSDLPWEKPNPNIFYAACNFLGVKSSQCAMIGDNLETDIKGGHCLGATFWLPLNHAEIDLSDVTHPPDVTLRTLLDLYKYFPAVYKNNVNTSTTNISSTQSKRRGSHISYSSTLSTCDSEIFYSNHYQQHNFQVPQQKKDNEYCNRRINKYRRGGSLPAIECFNSFSD